MKTISNEIRNEIKNLSEKEINKLLDLMDIGLLNDDLDKDEKILIISTESENKIKRNLKKLKEVQK